MDINIGNLLKQYGHVVFEPDGRDELNTYMIVDNYKVHVRNDDAALVQGLSFRQFHPLINKLSIDSENVKQP